jgi:prevent-host-death family protein
MMSNLASRGAMDMGTKIMPVSDLRRRTSDVIAAARDGGAIYITQFGRPVVVMVDYKRYERMIAQLEDHSDHTSLEAVVAEPPPPYLIQAQRYPTVANPVSSLDAWVDLLPEGYDGDALADTEELYDKV